MLAKLIDKISTLGAQHQAFVAITVTFAIVCFSWGVEKILEHYIFYNHPLAGYLIAIIGGLLLLWLTEHVILHVI